MAPASAPEVASGVEPTPAAVATDEVFLGWTAGDRWFFSVLGVVLLVAVSVHAVRLSGWGVTPIPIDRPEARKYEFQLDVNTATWVEWMQLDGVGEALGRRIVADREANGPFRSVDDVGRIKGIGDAKLDALRPWLRYSEATARGSGGASSAPASTDDPPTAVE